jgi:hypothetical protein
MSGFNEAKFRAEAKAAGYSEEEINDAVGAPSASVPPPSTATESANKVEEENKAAFENKSAEIKSDYEKGAKKATTTHVQLGDYEADIPSVFTSPLGLGIGLAATYGAYQGGKKAVESGKKVFDSLRDFHKDRLPANTSSVEAAKIEPTFDVKPTAPAPTPSAQTLTPTQLVESAQPSSIPEGMTPETDVGKIPKDMGLVEKGTGNTVINAADKKVIEAEKALAKQGAIVPKGMKPDYLKPKGGIGVGPYHWFENQVGVERAPSLWRELFGEKNVPLKDVQEKYKAFAQSVPEGYTPRSDEGVLSKRGGNFGKTSAVPEYIRGSSSIEGMARTGLAALGILPVAQKLKQGDFKGALNEAIPASALIDPRLSLALSPLYTSEEEIATLKKAEQGRKVGAGRGIAPPSAYQR